MRPLAPALTRPAPRFRVAWQNVRARGHALAFAGLTIAAFGVVLGRRWEQMGPYVTGPDPGNWFAYGRGIFGGVGPSSGGVYPPLVPAALHIMRWVLGTMAAGRLVGIGSLAALMAATCYVAARGMNRWLALAAAVGVGLSSQVTEATAFGGYPQNYALAFLLVAAVAFATYLQSGSRREITLGAVALAGAALSHHMYYALACLVIAFVWLLWLTTRPTKPTLAHRTAALACAALPSVLCFLPTFVSLQRHGYSAPIDANRLDALTALDQGLSQATWLWIPAISTAVVFLAFTVASRRQPVWAVATALLVTVVAVFPPTGEMRLLPLLSAGTLLGAGLALEALGQRSGGVIWSRTALAGAALFIILLFPRSDSDATERFAYYHLADHSLQDAAGWIAAHADQHLVVVRQDGRNWPLGWWFQGLTRAHILVGSSPRWLGFPREQRDAALVNRFFEQQASETDLATLASTTNVRYVVVPKDWSGWQQWAGKRIPPFTVAFENTEYLIVDVLTS